MSCISQIDFSAQCPRYGMGGVRAIWIGFKSAQTGVFYVDDGWCITNDTPVGFIRIPGSGSFQSVAQVDETTGLTYYRDELSFTPAKGNPINNTQQLAELQAADPDDLLILVETWTGYGSGDGYGDGNGYIMGKASNAPIFSDAANIMDVPVFFGGGQVVTGQARSDFNGQQFTLTSVHPLPALGAYLGELSTPSTD